MAEREFDRDALIEAFGELGKRAYEAGKVIEISVYGGSALTLMFDWRVSTRDVDALFVLDKTFVRETAADIARDYGWDEDWLNDGVSGFLSENDGNLDAKRLFGTFPSENEPGLRVMVAEPAYLFAMKCCAMRLGAVDENSDVDDIRRLAKEIGLSSADEAFELLAEFYPVKRIPPKTQFGLEEIFENLNVPDQEKEQKP